MKNQGTDFSSAHSGNFWEKAACGYTYNDVWRLVQDVKDVNDVNDVNLRESSIRMRFKFEIPFVISLAESELEKHLVDDMILNHVVLVKRTIIDPSDEKITRLEALTCLEYMCRRWGSLGEQILKETSTLCKSKSSAWLRSTYEDNGLSRARYSMRVHDSKLEIIVRVKHANDLAIFISTFDWLCKAIRRRHHKNEATATYFSASGCRVSICTATDSQKSRLCLDFSLRRPIGRVTELEPSCWKHLFEYCSILEEEGFSEYVGPLGKGLEMSFNLMVSLAASEYPVQVNHSVVLVGYHTVLAPTRLEESYVQFHLHVDKEQQINPFNLNYGEGIQVTDYTRFKSLRCFVGWCEAAHITLGTQQLPITVKYSGAREQRKTLHMTGFSAGGQALSAAPIQAGLFGQANFSFLSHRLTFSAASVYSKMLCDVSNQVALIADVTARRSWLVPKLSLMLHMAHAWVVKNGLQQSTFSDPIPFADPHCDGIAVMEALEAHGDIAVCGHDNDSFTLRSLFLGLSINLLATVSLTERSRHNNLYGFEFMDIISEPGRGAFMKKIKIKPGQSWLALANLADAVIVCSEIGEAIAPVGDSRRKSACNILPTEQDYLAAHITCLGCLAHRAGGELVSTPKDSRITLSQKELWDITGEPFETCTHDAHSTETCWKRRSILQRISKKKKFHSLPMQERTPLSSPRSFSLNGAVVFGGHRDAPAP
ncbi:hypothetical protein MMC07_007015 [Pseudocyphellaria aurata]|nr:hypothetical protein [Pseudocyphellaria aurata]